MGSNLPRIIGLNGLKRSGKDTIGAYLVKEHGYNRLSFAAPLYDAVYALNPFIDNRHGMAVRLQPLVEHYNWEYLKDSDEWGPEVRHLLEHMGTEVGRELFGENFWVDQAVAKIKDDKRYVFTDMRFPNEFDAVDEYKPDAYLLKVMRPGTTPNGHVSDKEWDNAFFDGSVMNDDTIESLETRVLDMLRVGR